MLGAASFAPAEACEFHDMGFGPMGSKWAAYYPDDPRGFVHEGEETTLTNPGEETSARESEANAQPPRKPARPTFSSASIRAANSAKAKLAKEDPLARIAPNLLSKSDR